MVAMESGPSAWLRGALHELSSSECLELVAQKDVGRIAFWSEDEGPTVLPVNYVVDTDGIRFRTSPYAGAARVGGSLVAFEVDETDDFTESGWSVLLRGVAEVLLGEQPGPAPEPWAEGVRSVTVRVPATSISGRRVMGL